MVQKKERRMIFSLHSSDVTGEGWKGGKIRKAGIFFPTSEENKRHRIEEEKNLEKSRVRKSATKPDPSIEFFLLQSIGNVVDIETQGFIFMLYSKGI